MLSSLLFDTAFAETAGSSSIVMEGKLVVNDIEGAHYELQTGQENYVLLTEDTEINSLMAQYKNGKVRVFGRLVEDTTIYMRGSVIKVEKIDVLDTTPASISRQAVFTVGNKSYHSGGQTAQMDAAPFVVDGRTLVPVRYLALSLGIPENKIYWDPSRKLIMLTKVPIDVVMIIGSNIIHYDDHSRQMDTAPLIREGRTYLPARYVAEGFGYKVYWDSKKKEVIIGQEEKTLLYSSGNSTPPVISGTPALSRGTLAEAEKGVGFCAWQPSYLPVGVAVEKEVAWDSRVGYLTHYYRIGDCYYEIGQRLGDRVEFDAEMQSAKSGKWFTSMNINGSTGWMDEVHPEPTDKISKGQVTIKWYHDNYIFTISGDLPLKEELIKVAKSIQPPEK